MLISILLPCLLRIVSSIFPKNQQNCKNTFDSGKVVADCNNKVGIHELASAITYARRIALGSLLAIYADDDDGNLAAEMPPAAANVTFIKDTVAVPMKPATGACAIIEINSFIRIWEEPCKAIHR